MSKKVLANYWELCIPQQRECTCSMCLKKEFNGEPEFYRVIYYNSCEMDMLCKFCLEEVRKFIGRERRKSGNQQERRHG